MKGNISADQRIANMIFASVYPLYLAKVQKKGRSEEELMQVIMWLTQLDATVIQQCIQEKVSFETFFERGQLNPKAALIKGSICGYKVEEIENPLTQKVRYLDKLIDDLAKGKSLEKILFM